MKLDDRGTIEMISENPHMQYFVGLESFTSEPMMDPSLLSHRKPDTPGQEAAEMFFRDTARARITTHDA